MFLKGERCKQDGRRDLHSEASQLFSSRKDFFVLLVSQSTLKEDEKHSEA